MKTNFGPSWNPRPHILSSFLHLPNGIVYKIILHHFWHWIKDQREIPNFWISKCSHQNGSSFQFGWGKIIFFCLVLPKYLKEKKHFQRIRNNCLWLHLKFSIKISLQWRKPPIDRLMCISDSKYTKCVFYVFQAESSPPLLLNYLQ